MSKEIWLSVDEVSHLSEETKETVRRKCKRGEYVAVFEKQGKYKNYFISLDSLPLEFKRKYYKQKEDNKDSKFYKKAPTWAKKQASKYLELIELIQGMKHKEIVEFLENWNRENPDKKSSYSALCKAKVKFKQFGKDALLSKKELKDKEYRIKPEYYEYYKNLYLSSNAPSIYNCWFKTLVYAMDKDNVAVANFPSEKTFDRYLKKDVSPALIEYLRHPCDKVLAKDLSNLETNECWCVESYQFEFPVKFKKQTFYPWITVVKDLKTSKWLSYFVYHSLIEIDHIFQAIYYALIKYGAPKEVIIKNTNFHSYINSVGKLKKADIKFSTFRINGAMASIGINTKFILPKILNIKSIAIDLKNLEKPKADINLFELKNVLDDYIENSINKKYFRSKALAGLNPNKFWDKTYLQQTYLDKNELKFLCKRNANMVKIGRNGIYDSITGKTYWSKKVGLSTGKKVFFRRDIYSDDDIAVYEAHNEKFFDFARYIPPTPALANTLEDKAIVRDSIKRERWVLKQVKSYLKGLKEIPIEEKLGNYKAVYESDKQEDKPKYHNVIIKMTSMDRVVKQIKEQEQLEKERNELISKLAKDLM